MSAEYVVEWHELLPFEDFDWRTALQLTLNMLRLDYPVRFRSPSDQSCDMLVIAYMAGDHERIVQSRDLASYLDGRSNLAHCTVVLVACANRKPTLSAADVRELLIDQGSSLAAPRHMRSTLPAALTGDCQTLLLQCLEERQLMELPPTQFEESETVRPQLVNPRRRFESV